MDSGIGKSPQLGLSRPIDPLSYFGDWLAGGIVREFSVAYGRDFDVNVDSVEEGARDFGPVAVDV